MLDDVLDETIEDDASEDERIQTFLTEVATEFERDVTADEENRLEAYDDIRFVADPRSQWYEEDR
ncbi:MAG: hypothetical protein AAFQ67_09980, partial [Pseudomonadota bacterium]